jgi:hypothetical protein
MDVADEDLAVGRGRVPPAGVSGMVTFGDSAVVVVALPFFVSTISISVS